MVIGVPTGVTGAVPTSTVAFVSRVNCSANSWLLPCAQPASRAVIVALTVPALGTTRTPTSGLGNVVGGLVSVKVGGTVSVKVGVTVGVDVEVTVGVDVGVTVGVKVGVTVGVGVGEGAAMVTRALARLLAGT